MTQTAVEFTVEELNKSIGLTKFVDTCDEEYKQEILGIIEQAKAMEKEQNEFILNYIKEVRDLCNKLRFPTEEELRELAIKADNILLTFKSE